jgi:hypothetical protein
VRGWRGATVPRAWLARCDGATCVAGAKYALENQNEIHLCLYKVKVKDEFYRKCSQRNGFNVLPPDPETQAMPIA